MRATTSRFLRESDRFSTPLCRQGVNVRDPSYGIIFPKKIDIAERLLSLESGRQRLGGLISESGDFLGFCTKRVDR